MSDDTFDLLKNDPVLAKALGDLDDIGSGSYQSDNSRGFDMGWADGIGQGHESLKLLDRGDVQADIRAYFKERDGVDITDPEELKSKFYSDRTWRNMNTVSMARDIRGVTTMSDEQATRLARIQKLYDSLPAFYEEGGRGIGGLAQNAAAAIIDPINLLGGVFGKVAGGSAMKVAARAAIKEAGKDAGKVLAKGSVARAQVIRRGMLEGAKAGAKAQAIEGAATGALQDAMMQDRNTDLGLQDGYSVGQAALNTGAGALVSGGAGALFGAGGAAVGGKVSRALKNKRNKVFGEPTAKYTDPDVVTEPAGVSATVDAEAATAGAPIAPVEKADTKVTSYIAAQREQYQRNLDATIDDIRSESGDTALAQWRSGTLKDADKTAAMKQADQLQAGRTAINELYNWPAAKAALERDLERFSSFENPKPDQLTKMNEINDRIQRGDDAFEAITRAAGAGDEAKLDKALADFANLKSASEPEVQADPNQVLAQLAQTPKPKEEADAFKAALDDVTLAEADEKALGDELQAVTLAKQGGQQVDAAYEKKVATRFKEVAGRDFVPMTPDVGDIAPAIDEPLDVSKFATAAEANEAIGSVNRDYNNTNNKINRLQKAVSNGKAKPEQVKELERLVAKRDQLNTTRRQLKDRTAQLSRQEMDVEAQPVIRSIEAEAAEAPLDVEGAASFLADYGFPPALIKREMAEHLKAKTSGSVSNRAKVAREFVGEKIRYARSLSHLEQVMDKTGQSIAFIPSVMRRFIEADTLVPDDMRADTLSRYNEWVNTNAQPLLSKYLAEADGLDIDDILGLIRQNHGEDMERIILDQLAGDSDILQLMAVKSSQPQGWDQLTVPQRERIDGSIEALRGRLLTQFGGAVSESKIRAQLVMTKARMVEKQLADDFGAYIRTSRVAAGQTLDANTYAIVVDPETKGNITGKVWNRAGDGTYSIDSRDKHGLQAMFKKATNGRATKIDDYGDLVIENPFFGTLLARDLKRNPDGTIDFAKTVEGKYVTRELPNGELRYVPKRYDAKESAKRALEAAKIARANNRVTKVKADVANLQKGDSVTGKQLAAAEVEAARSNPNRKDLNNRATGPEKDESAEALNKELRAQVNATVLGDAARNAMDTAPDSPVRAYSENVRAAEAELGEEIPMPEREAAWSEAEAENRSMALADAKRQRVADAHAAWLVHQDGEQLLADLRAIEDDLAPTNVRPKAHADKPVGAKNEPRVYVHAGYEVDVRNHFTQKKTSEQTSAISFFGEKIGDIKTNSDGSATLLYTDAATGLETSIKASSMDQLADNLPNIFSGKVKAAGKAGKLTRSFDETGDRTYAIDWKASNTWGKNVRTIPVETPVEEAAKLVGPVSDWKSNPDVSAINLDIPKGHVLAVNIREGDFINVTRVESAKSATPQTIGAILKGQSNKAYTVGYVPEGTRSASRDATRLFQPLDAQDPVARAGSEFSGSAKGKNPKADVDDLGQVKLESISAIDVDQNDLPVQFRDKGLTTLAKVHNLITKLENVRWSDIASEGQYATFVQDISDLYATRAKYAPQGIKMPTASRQRAMKQWRDIIGEANPTALSTGLDILRRLSYNDRDLAILQGAELNGGAGGYALPLAGSDAANRVMLDMGALDGGPVPAPVALLHEMAHWAYMNVLSDADRLQFWQSMGKFVGSEGVDFASLNRLTPGVMASNAMESPAELFANQMAQWAISGGKVNNIPLWTKMAKTIVDIARAFGVRISGDRANTAPELVNIDPDLAELFTKILPDTDPMYGRFVGLHKMLEDIRSIKGKDRMVAAASTAADALVKMDFLRSQLDEAIQSANPESLELALDDVSAKIRGMVGGKRGAKFHEESAPGTGGKRLRLFDGNYPGSANARVALLTARNGWKKTQLDYHAATGKAREFSTADLDEVASGDLASGFNAVADFAYSVADDDLTAKMTAHAMDMMNALNIAQDEARAAIGRVSKKSGTPIRVFKDGAYEAVTGFQKSERFKAARASARRQMETMAELAEHTKEVPNATDREALEAVDFVESIDAAPASSLSDDAINAEYKALAGQRTPRKKELEAEIKQRVNSRPALEVRVPPDRLQDIPLKTLEKDMFSAIKRGKFDDFAELANALAWKNRSNLETGIIVASSPKVRKAITTLQTNNAVPSIENGVPTDAPLHVRDTIKAVTHRSRADENVSRTVASRLFAIMGKGGDALTEEGYITRSDIARVLGMGDIADDTLITESDELFGKFRDELRVIGKDIRTQAGKISAAQKVSKMAVNLLVDEDELSRLGTNADELANAFSAVMRRTNSLDNIFDALPESSRARIFDLFKENLEATSLVMTGMLNGAAKNDLQMITLHGNMMATPVDARPFQSATAKSLRGVSPHVADNYKKEWVANTGPTRRASVETFSAKPLEESVLWLESPPMELLQAKGVIKPVSVDVGYGDKGVYLSRRVAASDDLEGDLKWSAERVSKLRDKVAREQANTEALRADGQDVSDHIATNLRPAVNQLRQALDVDARLWRAKRSASGNPDLVQPDYVVPFVARASNSFDVSASATYNFGTESANSLDWLLSSLEADGHIKSADADAMRATGGYGMQYEGTQIYGDLADAIARNIDNNHVGARNILNEKLGQFGYDSLDDGDGVLVFNASNIRHAEDPAFITDDFVQKMMGGENRSVAGQYLEALMEHNVDTKDATALLTNLQQMGMPAVVGDVKKRVFQNKPLSMAALQVDSWFTKAFGENSVRIRKNGAQWLADKIKPLGGAGFYEMLDSLAAKSLMVSRDDKGRPISVLTKLRNLPGTPGVGKRWLEGNKGLVAPFSSKLSKVPQPKVYDAIVMALRMGDDADKAIAMLPKQAAEAARDIQNFFRQQLIAARNDGLPLGFKRNYFPQVWDADVIKLNPDKFDQVMADYFMQEMRRGEIPMPTSKTPQAVAMEKAQLLRRTLTDEGSDGVMLPDNAMRTRMEAPFFERVINFSPSQMPAAHQFLMQDLEGIIAKYADQLARRRTMTKQFGLGNHAAATYLDVISRGKDAIVDALRSTKNFNMERRAADATMDRRVTEVTEFISPIKGTDEEVADLVDGAMKILGTSKDDWRKNKERVRQYLLNLQEPDIVASQPEFAKRVDAIVNALAEFGGQYGAVEPHELRIMADVVAGASKKPRDNFSPTMVKFSRRMRTFNSITMLAFTTLASIPDVGMPAIRSGNMKAAYKVWSKHMRDPHYREMARNVGVGLESIMHERMAHMYNDTTSRVSNGFFNLTFLNNWTNLQREAAALVGFESFKAEAKRAQDLLARGQQGTRQYNTAMRYLQRYGLEKYAMKGAPALSESNMVDNDIIRQAMLRFTNESIFAPNPNDIPMWAQGPVGAMMFQLKSYPLMMGRMSKYVAQEAKAGNWRPLFTLMASAGALGSASLSLRDMVQVRGEDGLGDTRDRFGTKGKFTGQGIKWYNDMAKSLGLPDIENESTADAVIGWFAESFMVAGGFGLFADLLHSTAEQADNADYGTLRVTSAVFGPSAGKFFDAAKITQGAMSAVLDEEPDKRTGRTAMRQLAAQVPLAGQVRAFREGMADIAGETSKPGAEKKANKIL